MHYAIFIPDGKPGGDKNWEIAGLQGLESSGNEWFPGEVDGKRGTVAMWRHRNHNATTNTEEYNWTISENGLWYLGIHKEEGISPADLELNEMLEGNPVEMGDGNEWVIPIAWKLPEKHRLVENEWVRKVSRKYEWYQEEAFDICEQIFSQIENVNDANLTVAVSVSHSSDLVSRALCLNYRLTPEVISAIGLINRESFRKALVSICDLNHILATEDEKKKESAGIGSG